MSKMLSSTWITASAGTGKTHQIVLRILQLLILFPTSRKILCVTYTCAAANEMRQRTQETLHHWSTLDDQALQHELHAQGLIFQTASLPDIRLLSHNAHHRLIVETLHGYCVNILYRHHADLSLPANFCIVHGQEELYLKNQAFFDTLQRKHASFPTLLRQLSHAQLKQHCFSLLDNRADVYGFHPEGHTKSLTQFIRRVFAPYMTQTPSDAIIGDTTPLPDPKKLIGQQQWIVALRHFLQKDRSTQQTLFMDYVRLFQRQNTKKCYRDNPFLQKERDRVLGIFEQLSQTMTAQTSEELIQFTADVLVEYQTQLQQKECIGLTDVLQLTLYLLTTSPDADDIRYALTTQLSHIIIDEAQDLTKEQWKIIEVLGREVLMLDAEHTLFAVGDPKQSIYSFRHAAPELFDYMGHSFAKILDAQRFVFRSLDTSYRSAPMILETVDRIFNQMTSLQEALCCSSLKHQTVKTNDPSTTFCVVPFFSLKESKTSEIAWHITQRIQTWFQQKKYLEHKKRHIEPGDIMILFRKRQMLMHELGTTLKAAGLSVKSSEKVRLTEDPMIQGLLSAGYIAITRQDSKAKLQWFKLIGVVTPELSSQTHKADLEALFARNSDCMQALTDLQACYRQSSGSAQFFYTALLSRYKKLLLERYPSSAPYALHAFSNALMQHCTYHAGGLYTFLEWMQQSTSVITPLTQTNSIYLSTVHGAKGLQASIVFLLDDCTFPLPDPMIYDTPHEAELRTIPFISFKHMPCQYIASRLEKKRLALRQEYYRLLYVALTRSENEVYCYGYGNRPLPPKGSWYEVIASGVKT